MKTVTAALLGVAAIAIASPVLAKSTASSREYKRGFADCSAGKWDENQHGASYKEGCRAAEDGKGGAAATGDAAAVAPSDAGADNISEPVMKSMLAACRAKAAKAYKGDPNMVDTKYEGTRTDGTHPVNGMIRIGEEQKTFQCSFDKKGKRLMKFVKN